ncbi:MAG: T9SS type A sorting domain-containing protein [Flavobacteriales bacterium]
MTKYYAAAFMAATFALNTTAQESEGGLPASTRHGLSSADVPVVRTVGIDLAAVTAEDAHRAQESKVPIDARVVPVDADLATSGTWYELPNGDGIWRLRIESPGALATELFFHDFHLPTGGLVYVYSPDGEQMLGGFSAYHNKANGIFATDRITGEASIVEYFEPAEARGEGRFRIATLGHTYRWLGNERADDCEVDVNCSEGANWVPQRDGVVKLRIVDDGGIFFCSGGLVNNVRQDCKRYVLTAMHCGVGVSASDLAQWKFYFGYQRTGCGTGSATQNRVKTGCVKRADSNDGGGNNGSDFLLLELDDEISASWDPYWLGWDATTNLHVGGVGIHHPAGSEKKISTYSSSAQPNSSWNGMSTHYKVNWVGTANGWGVTEGGSSGSPLFSGEGRVIGTLTGGSSYCNSVQPGGQNQPDFYGRMNYHWTSNGTPANERLKTYLDPDNTGALVLDGSYNPCGPIGVNEYATLERPLVSPNPATDLVRITFPSDAGTVERVEVLDVTGKLVRSQRPLGGSTVISVEDLRSGVYFVRITTDRSVHPAARFEVLPH